MHSLGMHRALHGMRGQLLEDGRQPRAAASPRSRNTPCARGRLVLWPVGAAKRKRFFTRAARKTTALHVRSAIMPFLSEVAPYDFRP